MQGQGYLLEVIFLLLLHLLYWGSMLLPHAEPSTGKIRDGWVPEQKITVEEALTAYTLNGAYASFEEDIKGTLETGKLADFVILSEDITAIDPVQIAEVQVLQTYVGGQKVFDSSNN